MFLGAIDDIDDDFRMGPVPCGVGCSGSGEIVGLARKSKGEVGGGTISFSTKLEKVAERSEVG